MQYKNKNKNNTKPSQTFWNFQLRLKYLKNKISSARKMALKIEEPVWFYIYFTIWTESSTRGKSGNIEDMVFILILKRKKHGRQEQGRVILIEWFTDYN